MLDAKELQVARAGIKGSLLWKYGLLVCALVSATVLASGLIEAWFSYRDYQGALVATQRESAAAAVNKIAGFVDENEHALRGTTLPLQVDAAEVLAARHEVFRRLLRQAPAITEVAYVDSLGREQLRVSRIAVDVVGSGADRSTEPAYVVARSRQTYYGPVYFRDESEPFMRIAIPGDDSAAGVTIAELNLKFIWDVVSQISTGNAGNAYVVGADGTLIAHPDLALVLRRTDVSDLTQVRAALDPTSRLIDAVTVATVAQDLGGRQVLSTSAAIKSLGWTVFVEQPLEAVFGPLYASLARTAILLLVGLGLSGGAGLMLVRHMLGPIRALSDAVARIGAGALNQRITVRTGDELELLAEGFNEMAARLRELYSTLEQKVEDRTHELAAAVHEIERQRFELADWNRTLEGRVQEQVSELERLGRLRRFLSAQVAELVVASGEQGMLESHRQEVTLLACGLRGFAAFSESSEPEEVMAVLREFHSHVGEVIARYGGTLERFAGEGFFVLFNDPVPCSDPALKAVQTALAMRERTSALSGQWRKRGRELALATGIATGYATLGIIGFEGRQDYAAVGSVNYHASELYTRAGPGQILISQRVFAEVRERVQTSEVDDGSANNGVKRAQIYSVVALKGDPSVHKPHGTSLSAREREVAGLIARGLTNRQIAANLMITERTAATHIEHILVKLDFASRTQIGVWAAENGLLVPAEP